MKAYGTVFKGRNCHTKDIVALKKVRGKRTLPGNKEKTKVLLYYLQYNLKLSEAIWWPESHYSISLMFSF